MLAKGNLTVTKVDENRKMRTVTTRKHQWIVNRLKRIRKKKDCANCHLQRKTKQSQHQSDISRPHIQKVQQQSNKLMSQDANDFE